MEGDEKKLGEGIFRQNEQNGEGMGLIPFQFEIRAESGVFGYCNKGTFERMVITA